MSIDTTSYDTKIVFITSIITSMVYPHPYTSVGKLLKTPLKSFVVKMPQVMFRDQLSFLSLRGPTAGETVSYWQSSYELVSSVHSCMWRSQLITRPSKRGIHRDYDGRKQHELWQRSQQTNRCAYTFTRTRNWRNRRRVYCYHSANQVHVSLKMPVGALRLLIGRIQSHKTLFVAQRGHSFLQTQLAIITRYLHFDKSYRDSLPIPNETG